MKHAIVVGLEILILILLIYLISLHSQENLTSSNLMGNFDHSLHAKGEVIAKLRQGARILNLVSDEGQQMPVAVFPTQNIPQNVLIAHLQGKVV